MTNTQTTKHTPGPWRIVSGIDVVDFYDYSICSVATSNKTQAERKANARLIAAAPDMYDALKNIMHGIDTGAITSDHDETFANAIKQANAAISAAEGK